MTWRVTFAYPVRWKRKAVRDLDVDDFRSFEDGTLWVKAGKAEAYFAHGVWVSVAKEEPDESGGRVRTIGGVSA